MIPAAFDYLRAGSTEEVVAALVEHGDDAKVIAGGMSLLPLMKLRLATPTVLVDAGRIDALSYVRDAGEHVAIGALTRHRELETSELLGQECGVLRGVAAEVGDCKKTSLWAAPGLTTTGLEEAPAREPSKASSTWLPAVSL